MNKDDFNFGPFSDFDGEIDYESISVTEIPEDPKQQPTPSPRNADPVFVALREERRQRGIAAKRVRFNPSLVAYGRRSEKLTQPNSARRNKAI